MRLQYGPTGALLSNLRVAKQGDLFIAADDGAVADARKFELWLQVEVAVVQAWGDQGVVPADDVAKVVATFGS